MTGSPVVPARRGESGRRHAGRWRIALLACVLLAAIPVVCADPPAMITISETAVFTSPDRGPVRFTHGDHMALEGVTCLTCHHRFEDGKNVLDPATLEEDSSAARCATCHTTPARLQKAFHATCISCHDAEKRAGRVTGPRTCGECHPWKR
jgi:hypothetical protein